MPSQTSETVVSHLIIPKARIQSVPSSSSNQFSNFDSNDSWIIPTPEKRPIVSPFTQNSRLKSSAKVFTRITHNRFCLFSDLTDAFVNNSQLEKMDQEPENLDNSSALTKPPPSIFICVVTNYKIFCDNIKQLTKDESFLCKSSINGIKLSTSSPDSYRAVIKFLQNNKAAFYTYQLNKTALLE
jgi:hypothetical protein